MGRHDCLVLYNAANISEVEGCQEKVYPSTILREEVGAIEESLRESGFSPYVLSVDHFSKELVQTIIRIAPKFIFNLCEEINGRSELEMSVAGLLELIGIPYTGSGPFALGLALNKFYVKQILRAASLPAAKGYLHSPGQKVRSRAAAPRHCQTRARRRESGDQRRVGLLRPGAPRAAGGLHPRRLQAGRPGRRVSRRAGVQRLDHGGPGTGGARHFRDRLLDPARGRAAHRQLPRQVGRGQPGVHRDGADLSGRSVEAARDPDQGHRAAQLPVRRLPRLRPRRHALRRARQHLCSRGESRIPTSRRRPALLGRRAPPVTATPKWSCASPSSHWSAARRWPPPCMHSETDPPIRIRPDGAPGPGRRGRRSSSRSATSAGPRSPALSNSSIFISGTALSRITGRTWRWTVPDRSADTRAGGRRR